MRVAFSQRIEKPSSKKEPHKKRQRESVQLKDGARPSQSLTPGFSAVSMAAWSLSSVRLVVGFVSRAVALAQGGQSNDVFPEPLTREIQCNRYLEFVTCLHVLFDSSVPETNRCPAR